MQKRAYESLDNHIGLSTDEALNLVGGNGLYQKVHGFLYILLAEILNGIIIYGLAFLQDTGSIYFKCKDSSDWTRSKHNFVSDFDFVCSSDVIISLQGTAYFVGFSIGCLIWLPLGDKISKRYIILMGYTIHLLICLIVFFFQDKAAIFVFLFLLGFQIPPTTNMIQFVMLQFVSIKSHSWYITFAYGFEGVMVMFLPLYYKYTNQWFYVFFISEAVSIFGVLMFIFYFKPSPRELIAKSKYNEARTVLNMIAAWNKKPPFEGTFKHEQNFNQSGLFSSPGSVEQNKKQPQLLKQLCKNKELALRVVYTSILWFTINLVYFGIQFGLGKLSGDIYINGMISGGSQAAAYLICGVLMTVMGRRSLTVLSFLLTGIPLCIYSFINEEIILSYILVLIGKFGISSSFNVAFIWSVELFPTQVKGIAWAFGNFFGRMGGILAPLLSGVLPNWFILVFGALGIISAFICLLLPETKGDQIPDVIEDKSKASTIVMKVEEAQ